MKVRNAAVQERAHWDNLLGQYENTLRKMSEKLKKELRDAHYSQREELCRLLETACKAPADIISRYRASLGVSY